MQTHHKVVIFGEMLWDCLPSGPVPGGAPMNVALNLHQLGLEPHLISAVGKDKDGEKLVNFLNSFGLPTGMIQLHPTQETSRVLVDDSDPENIKYTIISPVAWDYIQHNQQMDQMLANADAFVFGTLAVRNGESLQTLLQLLQQDILRVFDVNLRPPYDDFLLVEKLLDYTDILKINDDELKALADYFNLDQDIELVCSYLVKNYAPQLICVTLGSKGAALYFNNKLITHAGYKVKVADTIGAGDAFLSGFIKCYLEGKAPDQLLDFACKLGAFVAGKEGGTPRYKLSDIENQFKH